MNELSQTILNICTENTLATMRTHPELEWAPDSYWWPGILLAWTRPFRYVPQKSDLTSSVLMEHLAENGISSSKITSVGKHHFIEMENISFVFRDKVIGDKIFLTISPHITGKAFRESGHAFVTPSCPVRKLAVFMQEIDACVPMVREACLKTYGEGLRERKEREIRFQVASVFLDDLFGGNFPKDVVSFRIADSTPGDMSLIRLTVVDSDSRFSLKRTFDIPFADRYLLPGVNWITDFIAEKGSANAAMEIFHDPDYGESVPVLRYMI